MMMVIHFVGNSVREKVVLDHEGAVRDLWRRGMLRRKLRVSDGRILCVILVLGNCRKALTRVAMTILHCGSY